MHSDHAVVHLSLAAQPLSSDSHRLLAALGHARLVHDPNGLGVSMVFGHDFLTPISQCFFIPLD